MLPLKASDQCMKKKIIFLLFFLFLLIFVYLFVKSDFNFFSTKYLKYFIVNIFFIILLILVFFSKKKTQEIFLTIFISIFSVVYFIEITMPIYVTGLYNPYTLAKSRKEFIKNYSDFKEAFPDGYPSWSPGFLKKELLAELDEDVYIFGGVPNKVTYHCSESKNYFESDQVYKSDRYGFNNPDYVYEAKNIEIVLIGDSFVHGSCVDQDSGYAGNLRKLLNNNGVVSIGWRGAGPFEELGMMTEYAIKLKPKYILWVYFEANDYIEIVREQKYEILKNYLNEGFSQNLINRSKEISDISKNVISSNLKRHFELTWDDKNVILSYLKHRIKIWNIRWHLFYRKSWTPNVDSFEYKKFEEIFYTANSRAKKNGSKLIFVYQTHKTRYKEENTKNEKDFNRSKILNIVKNLSIPIIDIHEAFINYNDPLKLWLAHPNEEGYKVAAEHIFKEMYSKGFK